MRYAITLRAAASALALLLGACGSSSREGSGDPTVSFVLSSETLTEAGGAHPVEIELHTATPLLEEVSFTVSDGGLGSATPGSDYVAIGDRRLSFPAGSMDGTREHVDVTPLADALVEGVAETVQLELRDVVGAARGSRTTFTGTLLDSDEARITFTGAATSSVDEHTGPRGVVIELDLDPGVRLGLDIDVNVVDLRTGSATPGSDYGSLPTFRLPFPKDSPDGTVRAIAVQVLDDSISEGAETVRLALVTPSPGAVLGLEAFHQFIIQDDDAVGSSTLEVSQPGGDPVLYGQLLHLGTRPLGSGPGAGTTVRLRNSGAMELSVGLPEVSGTGRGDFQVSWIGSETARQGRALAGAHERPLPFVVVDDDTGPGVALHHDPALVQDLAELREVVWPGFPIPDLGSVTLELRRVALPIAADAVVQVNGLPVAGGLRALVGEIELWSGSVVELEGSRVFLARQGSALEGRIELAEGARRLVQVVVDPGEGVDARVLRLADDGPLDWPGGGDFCRAPEADRARPVALPSPPTDPLPLQVTSCRLAIETDFQFYQRFGSTGGLADYVTGLVAAIGERFAADVGPRFTIAYLGIYTQSDDGWTTPDTGSSAAELLSEFKSAWASGWPVDADLAHFLSGAPLDGGAAFTDSLCDRQFGYAASADLRGNLNWSTWTGASGGGTWDFLVTAHELGHNFGARHTHEYCPPLDRCATSCLQGNVCSRGTLMSYCHLCGGGLSNVDLVFHPFTANVMRLAANASCLTPAALQPDEALLYSLQFAPTSGTGTLDALVRFPHEALNQPRPFEIRVRGVSTP